MMHDLMRRTDIVGKITSAEMQAQFREMSGREAYTAFIIALNDAPTIDAVSVVRCKDCVHAKNNYLVNGLCLCEKPIYCMGKGEITRNELMAEDDFCSYGERRSDA